MGNLQDLFGGEAFDATQVDPAADMSALPTGEYAAIIEDSSTHNTKKGDGGKFIELVHQVIDGPFKGRKVWARLNVVNKNETAQKIGKAQFSAVCHAVDVLNPSDTSDLHDKPLLIKVEHVNPSYDANKNPQGSKKETNEVKAWKKLPADFDASKVHIESRSNAPTGTQTPSSSSAPAKPFWQKDAA